jgi:chromosome segregation ATPase
MAPRNATEVHIAKLETNYEYLQAELERVNSNLDKINKVMFIGNGSPPLPTQISTLQTEVENLEHLITDKHQHLETNINLKFSHLHDNIDSELKVQMQEVKSQIAAKNIELQGSWKLKAVIATSITAIITSMLALIG